MATKEKSLGRFYQILVKSVKAGNYPYKHQIGRYVMDVKKDNMGFYYQRGGTMFYYAPEDIEIICSYEKKEVTYCINFNYN